MSEELHVVFGTGPVGCWIARALRAMGIAVRAVNRSGKRPNLMPEDVDIIAADLSDPRRSIEAAQGATVLYQALNPPYAKWHERFPALQSSALTAAKSTGARYVSIENLYMYDSTAPITEDSPVRPRSSKGILRARMAEEVMTAHARGEIQAAILRSSDYYGPGVVQSALGERVFGNLVVGKKAQLVGSAHIPHSWAYIEDVGRAAAILGTHDNASGEVWITPHAPARTQEEMVKMAGQVLGRSAEYVVISTLMMRVAGWFVPDAKASVEMMYQFTEPFLVTSTRFQQAFRLEATPIESGVEKTVRWYREHWQ